MVTEKGCVTEKGYKNKYFGSFHTSCALLAQIATAWSTRDTCTVCGHPTTTNWEYMCTVCGHTTTMNWEYMCTVCGHPTTMNWEYMCTVCGHPTTMNWEYTCELFVSSGNYFTMYKIVAVLAFTYHSSCHCYYFVYMYCLWPPHYE